MLDNTEGAIKKWTIQRQKKPQHNMFWTLLCVSKHEQCKQDMLPPTNSWRQRRTEHCFYAKTAMDITRRNSERQNFSQNYNLYH